MWGVLHINNGPLVRPLLDGFKGRLPRNHLEESILKCEKRPCDMRRMFRRRGVTARQQLDGAAASNDAVRLQARARPEPHGSLESARQVGRADSDIWLWLKKAWEPKCYPW